MSATPTPRGIPGRWPSTPGDSSQRNYPFPEAETLAAHSDLEAGLPPVTLNRRSRPVSDQTTSDETAVNYDSEQEKAESPPKTTAVSSAYSSVYELTNITTQPIRPAPVPGGSSRRDSVAGEDDIIRILSRRRTNASSTHEEQQETKAEIEQLLSSIFGNTRKNGSQEEKTRHLGVVFKNLTVKGQGLGASIQPTNGDFFLGPFRAIWGLFTKGSKAGVKKPSIRTLINNFNGCVKPGEMLLVLGRPGSGGYSLV